MCIYGGYIGVHVLVHMRMHLRYVFLMPRLRLIRCFLLISVRYLCHLLFKYSRPCSPCIVICNKTRKGSMRTCILRMIVVFCWCSDMQCRICLLEGNQANDPLISPCDCKGSIRFVHLECLRHWINGRLNFHEQQHKPIFVRQLLCELCKIPYPTAISYNNGEAHLHLN